MKTKTINLYEFNELSTESQEKAINNLSDINVDYDWWDFIYEDAKNIGLEITGFDLGRANYCKGQFIFDPKSVANEIIKQHGQDCETHKTALQYLEDSKHANYDTIEDINKDFLYPLLEDYRIILQHEYEYLTSKEAIIETIKANEYTFTIDGKLENI